MKKVSKIFIVLLVLLPLILASCSDSSAAAENKRASAAVSGTQGSSSENVKNYNTVDITFSVPNLAQSSDESKMVYAGYDSNEDYAVSDLYWRYTAVHTSDTSAPGNTGNSETTITDGKGVSQTVSGFAPGNWRFRLFGYTDDAFQTLVYRSPEGEFVLKDDNLTNELVCPVNKVQDAGNGKIKLIASSITFNGKDSSEVLNGLDNVHVYYKDGSDEVVLTSPTYLAEGVSPGLHEVVLKFTYQGVSYAEVIAVNVYSNFTTVISGEMDYRKLSTYTNIFKDFDATYKEDTWVNYSSFTDDEDFFMHTYTVSETLKTPVKDYFTFIGWTTATEWSDSVTTITSIPARTYEALTLNAKFVPVTYNINYDMNAKLYDGTTVDSSVKTPTDMIESYDYTSATFILKKNLTRDGYAFDSWSSGTTFDPASDTTVSDYEVPLNTHGDLNFMAHWVPNTYTVNFDGNKPTSTTNSVTSSTSSVERVYDETPAPLPESQFSLDGYTFAAWGTSRTDTATSYTTLTAVHNLTTGTEVTLYALWTPNTYHVIFNGNAEGASSKGNRSEVTGDTEAQTRVYDEGKHKLPESGYSRVGYDFVGWSTDSDAFCTQTDKIYLTSSDYNNFSTKSDITMYAIWKLKTYTVQFEVKTSPTNHGTEFGSLDFTSITSIEYRDKVSFTDFTFFATTTDVDVKTVKTVTAIPETSTSDYAYYFIGWSGYPESYEITEDITVTATFERKEQPKITPNPVHRATNIVIDFTILGTSEYAELVNPQVAGPFQVNYGDTSVNSDVMNAITGCTVSGHSEISVGGLYVSDDGSFSEDYLLVKADGKFNSSFDGYTDADGKWIKDGGTVTLYPVFEN